MNGLPRLRTVEVTAFEQDGRPMLFLRDRLRLSGNLIAVPQALGPALALADGTRDVYAIQAGLVARYGISVRVRTLEQLFEALDEVYLLDNERAAEAKRAALAAYRAAPHRTPALAGSGYPSEAGALKNTLDAHIRAGAHLSSPSHRSFTPDKTGPVRGLVSPHIDYQRGGASYGAVWGQPDVVQAARDAELAIILGTDHSGGPGRLTLTRQAYATPFGVLPAPRELIDELTAALGEEEAFEEELHHRDEHSVELAVTWLHHVRDGSPVEVLPVLCGSFHQFSTGQADPAAHAAFDAATAVLGRSMARRRTLVVAAADLAHVGPAFGSDPVSQEGQRALRAADGEMLEAIGAGDAGTFFAGLRRVEDANNVCGLPPIYLALRLLAPVTGEIVAYDQCRADDEGTSWVSVAGVVWR